MSFINKLLVASAFVLLLGGGLASAQQPVKPVNPSGAVLFPSAFASADNIAAQTATFLHGGLMAWDSGGSNWDRVLLTAGALNVQIQNSSLAVTGTFWQATQPISGSVTANAGTNLNTSALMLDATFTGRTPAGASPADNESNTNTALSRIGAFNFIWDSGGSNWDRWTGAVTQSGTWNVTNISGTISLPTGASTLAEQQTHTTSLQLIDDLPLAQGSTTSGQKGLLGMGAVTTAAPSYTTAQTSPLSLTTTGLLRIDGSAVTQPVSGTVTANAGTNLNTSLLALDTSVDGLEGGLGAAADAAATVGSTGSASAKLRLMTSQLDAIQTAVQLIDNAVSGAGYNITQFGGTNVVTGTGASGAGIPRMTLSNDSSLAANQSVNVNQLAGAALSVTNFMPGRLTDGTGYIDSDVIGSIRYLKASTVQDIEISTGNSSTTNLAAGASFTGTSNTTLGVGSIQVNLFSDQNMTIQVQQSQQDPGTNWDIVDSWTYTANSTGLDAARTIQATGSSTRVVVTNTGSVTSTTFRLSTALCPVCDSLPRGLTQLGNLRTAIAEPIRDSSYQEIGTTLNPFKVAIGGLSSITSTGLLADPTQATIVTLDPFGRLQASDTITDGSGRYAALRGSEGAQIFDAGLVTQAGIAPSLQCPYVANISVTAATQLVTNTGGQAIHVCAFAVVLAGAESVSLVEGTGSTCATGTKGLYGGTSASIAFAANGGSNLLSDRIILPMQVRGDNLCLLKSAANNASGTLVYGLY